MGSILKYVPGINVFLETNAWCSFRHRIALNSERRENSNFTGFQRLPTQFDALAGPVLDNVLNGGPARPLKVAVLGCSNGAEAYSVASVLRHRHPKLDFIVRACDIDPQIIRKAETGAYSPEKEIFNNRHMADDFVSNTFEVEGEHYCVKADIRGRVIFSVDDVLDEAMVARMGPADIIYAQNFLFHLKPGDAAKAFENICHLAHKKSVFFIDGMDLPLRQNLTRRHHLVPLDYKIDEIHSEARWARAVGWPQHYWGLEPFSTERRDWRRRYATIFLKSR
ncbi:MAG: hypothetical protein P0119_06195 [Nitrospira sp.]|nr:hypothetical protein [Nitrospira sp.]